MRVIPRFDTTDVGTDWRHGLQSMPDSLWNRGLSPGAILDIVDQQGVQVRYKVYKRPGQIEPTDNNFRGEDYVLQPQHRGG